MGGLALVFSLMYYFLYACIWIQRALGKRYDDGIFLDG